MAATKKAAKPKSSVARGTSSQGWTAEELAAMKEHNQEIKSAARTSAKTDGESEVLAKIAEMPEPDRSMAERIHAIVTENAPSLSPKTYYGMPAYAKDGKVLCFFQPAAKFKARYSTLGFDGTANLDEGTMWPTSWALTKLTAADEATIAALVRKAVS